MDNMEKSRIILNWLDTVMNVNYNMEDIYLIAISKGLKEIEEKENKIIAFNTQEC